MERGNTAPVITSSPVVSARVGEPYEYQPSVRDAEGDPVIFWLTVAPAGMMVNGVTGLIEWIPTAVGAQTVSLRAEDSLGLASAQTYSITVRPPNRAPSITSQPATSVEAGASYGYQVTATDPDLPSDGLAFSLTTAPAGMSVNPTTGLVQWQPAAGLAGTNQNVVVQVTDLEGLRATQSFAVSVTAPDLTRPTVSLAVPANGATLTQDIAMSGTATDDNLQLWRVEFRLAGET
jgi:hypothetical protein